MLIKDRVKEIVAESHKCMQQMVSLREEAFRLERMYRAGYRTIEETAVENVVPFPISRRLQ